MELRELYKAETGGWVTVDDYPHEEYTREYVQWLEDKVNHLDSIIIEAKPVTVWMVFNPKKGVYEHNHIQDNHADGNTPTSSDKKQKEAWQNKKWIKKFGYMIEGTVVTKQAT